MNSQEKEIEGQYKLSDLIDIHSLQLLMESFYATIEVPCAVVDLDGNILVAVGWQDICTKFHRINPITQKRCFESDTICAVQLNKKKNDKYVEYKCRNGLVDVAFPIIVEGNYLANLFMGQFIYESPDREFFYKQAEEVGFDVDKYMAALDKVPIWTKEKVDSIMNYYNKLATMLTDMGLQNLKLKRAEEELKKHSKELKIKNQKLITQIAEREQVEAALQESEEKFRSMFQNSTAGIAVFSSEGDILQVNPALCEFLGYPESELLQLNAFDPIHPEDREEISSLFEQMVTGKRQHFHFEKRYVRKDGSVVWGRASAVLLPYHDNNLSYVMGIVQDVTNRKKAEDSLRLNELRLESLLKLNSMVDASIREITDFVREEAVRLTRSKIGYLAFLNEEENVLEMHSRSKGVMEECKVAYDPIFYLLEATGLWGEAVKQRKPIITNDYSAPNPLKKGYPEGHVKLTRHMNIPVFDGGKVVAVIGVGNKDEDYDQSDVRQLTLLMQNMWKHIQRKNSEKELKASEEKYSTLVEKGDDGIIIIQDDIVKFANHKMTELVGRNKKDVVGSSIFEYIPEEYKEMVLEKFGIQLKSRMRIPLKYELEMLSRYDLKVPVEVNASLIEHSGEPAVMAIIRDITDRKVAEEKLKKYAEDLSIANEDLKSLDRMKDDLLSNVSHELKTPLVSIKGYTELLNDELLGTLNEKQKKATEVITRNSERLSNLIDSILYISISQAGKAKYAFKPIDISDVIDSVVTDMYPQIKENNLNIKKKVPENLPLIYADEDYISRLLINLVSNAIKFTPSSGNITISASSKENYLHLSVEDTGIGIPENLIPNLFQRFYQIDASTTRKYNGTGLGLHICKSIVEAHDGEIWVESEEGKGTKFHITMPLKR